MHSRSAAPTSLLDLMHRRAVLLGGSGAEAADGADSTDDELRAVTEELTDRLSTETPQVRRVRIDEPGELLERLVSDEPVHPFAAGAEQLDLADRLAEDRRCFVLEHPSLPGHPMNVVWVALWTGIPVRIGDLLDRDAPTVDPGAADTAVFYSIWNVEPGLVGIPGGTSLLSGAIEQLRAEFPGLVEFVTLSPIPGFRTWWLEHGAGGGSGGSETTAEVPPDPDRAAMTSACARYLVTDGPDGRPLDAVARFHMGNGARLVGLNWAADPSPRGIRRSFGLMANYRYAPEDLTRNRHDLALGRPAVGADIGRLLLDDPA